MDWICADDQPPAFNYSTADIRSLYGLTLNGLKFYEDKCLIAPEREAANGYRVFSMTECSRLFRLRILRQYGFSIDQCIDLVTGATAAELQARLSQRRAALQQEIHFKRALCKSIKRALALIRRAGGAPPLEKRMSPALLRLSLATKDRARGSACANPEDFQRWYEALPFTSASIMLEREAFLAGDPACFKLNLGFVAEASLPAARRLPASVHLQPLSPRPCLYTIVRVPDSLQGVWAPFDGLRRRLQEKGLRLADNPFTRMIGTFDAGAGVSRYDEAWLPLEAGK